MRSALKTVASSVTAQMCNVAATPKQYRSLDVESSLKAQSESSLKTSAVSLTRY